MIKNPPYLCALLIVLPASWVVVGPGAIMAAFIIDWYTLTGGVHHWTSIRYCPAFIGIVAAFFFLFYFGEDPKK